MNESVPQKKTQSDLCVCVCKTKRNNKQKTQSVCVPPPPPHVCVCVCVCPTQKKNQLSNNQTVTVCLSSLVFMVRVIFEKEETVYGFYGCSMLCLVECFRTDYLDRNCFESLICKCIQFLYLHLFSASEPVSQRKAL